ncbi:uncharacterized protein BX664DRAFT_322235, partial [Halteromyces radiatus]|uniref:uncharacterized protein n=1 Tax=Halteromyces radiatus TaxID=101107 RepID=UPI00221F8690
MSTIYWYSTNGVDRKRLADRHVTALDQAFERQTRVQIYDDEAFGNLPAIASPHLGTMTSGDIHYGLYRQPSLWESNDSNMDSMMLMLGDTNDHSIDNNNNMENGIIETSSSTLPAISQHLSKIHSDQSRPSDHRHSTTTTIRRRHYIRSSLDTLCCSI